MGLGANIILAAQNAENNKEGGGGSCDISDKIAGGHAGEEHYPDLPEDELSRIIDETMEWGEKRELRDGRTAYYDEETNTIVITDPNHVDGGTVFEPDLGYDYFDGLE